MKSFQQWFFESEKVFRIDPEIRDFASNLKSYYLTQSGSGPVDDTSRIPDWAGKEQGKFRKGLFAGKYHDIISYLIPRDIPWVLEHSSPKKTLYFDKNDYDAIKNYQPYISSFDASKFEPLGTDGQGEYFSENPPQPIKQQQIKNPLRLLSNRFNLIPLDSRDELKKRFEYFQKNGINADGEGLFEK